MPPPLPSPETTGAPSSGPGPSRAAGLLKLARPRQWIKNLLVFVAPAAASVLFHSNVLVHAVYAFGIFCLAASGTYFLNDAIDVEVDRSHPTKRNRPVASGAVPVPLAITVGLLLLVVAIVLAVLACGWHLAIVMAAYAAINVAYSLGLKNEPILDLVAVSSGFVLRAIAGGVATAVPLSNWFLIVTSFGSLLIVTGKRSGEKQLLAVDGVATNPADGPMRVTLGLYTDTFLRSVRTMAVAVTITAYCLWAFERAGEVHHGHDPVWFQLTIIPLVIALLHVTRLLDGGGGAAPEELAIHDHRLQIYGLSWVVLFMIGAYVA